MECHGALAAHSACISCAHNSDLRATRHDTHLYAVASQCFRALQAVLPILFWYAKVVDPTHTTEQSCTTEWHLMAFTQWYACTLHQRLQPTSNGMSQSIAKLLEQAIRQSAISTLTAHQARVVSIQKKSVSCHPELAGTGLPPGRCQDANQQPDYKTAAACRRYALSGRQSHVLLLCLT